MATAKTAIGPMKMGTISKPGGISRSLNVGSQSRPRAGTHEIQVCGICHSDERPHATAASTSPVYSGSSALAMNSYEIELYDHSEVNEWASSTERLRS